MLQIYYKDRETNKILQEKVAGERYLNWIYNDPLGRGLLEMLVKRKIFSYLYGKLQDCKFSKKKIPQFVKEYGIDIDECKKDVSQFEHFNDFFYRELKTGARAVDPAEDRLVSPADGRAFVYEDIDIYSLFQIKGSPYSLVDLTGDAKLAGRYINGSCIIIRLCPVDYHRFHFPCSGTAEKAHETKGSYYSVNPIALNRKAEIYCQNKRHLTVLHGDCFDDILLLEIGATCVGSIIQTFVPRSRVAKGAEKGYFKFGGSTVMMFLQANTVKIDEDLLINSSKGLETKVKMGMGIATKSEGM
ncbi:MAG: phosphatidylserine decarboxylase [Peptococcaceae bacterium]